MTRVKRGVIARARHKKILSAAKGYREARSKVFRVAKQAVIKSGQYAYRDRKQKKRNFASLWITRIGAAAKSHGISYSDFMNAMHSLDIKLNKKILADLAVNCKETFKYLAALADDYLQSLDVDSVCDQSETSNIIE